MLLLDDATVLADMTSGGPAAFLSPGADEGRRRATGRRSFALSRPLAIPKRSPCGAWSKPGFQVRPSSRLVPWRRRPVNVEGHRGLVRRGLKFPTTISPSSQAFRRRRSSRAPRSRHRKSLAAGPFRRALPSRPKAFADIRQPIPLPKHWNHADEPSLPGSSSGGSKNRKKLQLPEAQRKRRLNAFLSVEPGILYMIRRLVETLELSVRGGMRQPCVHGPDPHSRLRKSCPAVLSDRYRMQRWKRQAMIIEFSVKNYRSIKDEARLSLAANSDKALRETNVFAPTAENESRSIPLLRSAAIYGPNAAGKTNLLRALRTMQEIVARSNSDLGEIPVTPFQFDKISKTHPTKLEVIILVDGVRYQYGFSATSRMIFSEWLYAWPRGRPQLWFRREGVAKEKTEFKFGNRLTGDKEVWRRATRPNALFLSTAIALNSEKLRPIYNWFTENLHIAGIDGWGNGFTISRCHGEFKQHIINFLKAADLAISNIHIIEKELSIEQASLREEIMKDSKGAKEIELRVNHDMLGYEIDLDLSEESDGTQKIFALSGPWLDTLANGHIIVIDELHDNLHPLLVKYLVQRFHTASEKGAQLIFSTHDTAILDQSILRRDQIWFCERNDAQATSLYPLTDFHSLERFKNLERSYLTGRFGALPYVGRA